LLQVIAAILSLLLLAGVFSRGMGADDDTPATPADNAAAGHGENDFDGTP